MKDIILFCYAEGMSIDQAISFIESSYGKKVSMRSIECAKKHIKIYNCVEWK